MPAQKLRDLAVKTGEYQSNGQTKGRWENVGALMRSDDGSEFVILKRTFNPAGVPNPEGRDTLIVSAFRPDGAQGGQRQAQPAQGGYPQQPPAQAGYGAPPAQAGQPPAQGGGGGGGFGEDDIPFAAKESI